MDNIVNRIIFFLLLSITLTAFIGGTQVWATDHFIPDGRSTHEYVDDYVDHYWWTRGCAPSAAAMALSYGDNRYLNYGNLICWYHEHPTSNYNVSQLVDWLADAMGTNSEGGTHVNNVHTGIESVANNSSTSSSRFTGYNYNSRQVQSSIIPFTEGWDWCWGLIQQEIVANRPFVWTVLSSDWIIFDQKGHSLCAVGYTDDKRVILRDSNRSTLQYWRYNYWEYSPPETATTTQVDTIERGGGYTSGIKLTYPDGGETFTDGQSFNVSWYQSGAGIVTVSILVSQDKGNSWYWETDHVSSSEGSNSQSISIDFGGTFSAGSNYRLKIYGYDSSGVRRAGDGCRSDFTVQDKPNYTLSVNSSGASGVSISSSTGHGGTTNYTKTVTSGTSVTLTAPSTSGGKAFTGWTGDVTSSSQTVSFTMNGNKTVTANYAPPNDMFASAITISGTSGQTTGSNVGATKESGEPSHAGNSGGASVWWKWTAPASGQATINTNGSSFDTLLGVYTGSSVGGLTLVASDDDGGDGTQSLVTFNAISGITYRIVVDGFNGATGNIILNWSLISTYTLTVNSSGASSVSISSSTGHSGTTNYAKTVTSGTSVNLQALQYVGSCASRTRFNGWTGSVTSSSQSITFTMDGNKTVTANYVADPETYTLTVNSSGVSSVSISSSTGHGGTTNYTKTVTCGTTVTLTAPSTASGQTFTGWTGDVPSGSPTISFSMNGTKTVTANYMASIYTLTVNSSGASGVIISSSTGHEGTTNYTKSVTNGTTVTLTAPSTAIGQTFTGWTGDVPSGSQTISFLMNGHKTVIANYVAAPEPDIDSDGAVNFTDFAILASHWLNNGCGEMDSWCDGADVDSSSMVDFEDLLIMTEHWLEINMLPIDNFESGDLTSWNFGGDTPWVISSDEKYSGNYAARSGIITDSQMTYMYRTQDVPRGYISFARKVSSEYGYDWFVFYIDGEAVDIAGGDNDWKERRYFVNASTHDFYWAYQKDSSVSEGSDRVWVDDIVFYPQASNSEVCSWAELRAYKILGENMSIEPGEQCSYVPFYETWIIGALDGGFTGTFNCPTSGQYELRVTHQTSASESCPGGGYAPVTISVNGLTVVSNYDPAENHGGTHGSVTDSWTINANAGSNTFEWIANNLCTNYWIQKIEIIFLD